MHPVLLVLAIFFARVVDVSLGTLRTLLVFRGHAFWAAGIGFFEILIWIVAAGQVLQNLDTWYFAVAYAGGFAGGNLVGLWVERKLALGSELVRAVSTDASVDVAQRITEAGFDVIELAGQSGDDPVEVLLIVAPRRRVPGLLARIAEADPRAVCTVSDVKEKTTLRPLVDARPRVAAKRP